MAIPVGTSAPDFTLLHKNADGFHPVTLSDHKGKDVVVLLFFPAAFTPPCTTELCDVSNGMAGVSQSGAVIYGISGDTGFAQEAWANANNITVKLLSDYAKSAGQAYDVVLQDLLGMGPANKRAAFVIDKEGTVKYSEVTPTPLDLPNFDAIRAAIDSLN